MKAIDIIEREIDANRDSRGPNEIAYPASALTLEHLREIQEALRHRQHRGTGLTTRQLLGCGPRSMFVWCNDDLKYPFDLCRALGRLDILLVRPKDLADWPRFSGRYFTGIHFDHACPPLTEGQSAGFEFLRGMIRVPS